MVDLRWCELDGETKARTELDVWDRLDLMLEPFSEHLPFYNYRCNAKASTLKQHILCASLVEGV